VLAALPAALSIFTPGTPLLVFYRAPEPTEGWFPLPFDLVITRSGAVAVMLFTTRLFIGVMLAVALALTTRWSDLLKAAYTQPTAVFVLVLTMMHHYLFVLVRTVETMHLARWSRTIVPASVSEERRWIGGRVAVLFSRSRRLSERVYQAMLARGYQGRPRTLAVARFGPPEAAWLIACGMVAAAALLVDRSLLANLPW
jgi:cobalt/nickel transport system permease protein